MTKAISILIFPGRPWIDRSPGGILGDNMPRSGRAFPEGAFPSYVKT